MLWDPYYGMVWDPHYYGMIWDPDYCMIWDPHYGMIWDPHYCMIRYEILNIIMRMSYHTIL